MRIHFRRVKDALSLPAHFLMKTSSALPETFQETAFAVLGLLLRSYYFVPRSHARRTLKNLCKVIGRSDPHAVYAELTANIVFAVQTFAKLYRDGAEAVAHQVRYAEGVQAKCGEVRDRYGSMFIVVPHCTGAVLSATLLGNTFPSTLLVRESKSLRRSEIMREYLARLGPELVFVRRASPTEVTRLILRAIRREQLIIGTTDLIRRQPDTVEVKVFGRRVWMPAWPARFSGRRNVPIAPVYPIILNGRIVVTMDEPYIEKDVQVATQRWATSFERSIRKYPADWPFMLEKRWSRVLAAAAAEV